MSGETGLMTNIPPIMLTALLVSAATLASDISDAQTALERAPLVIRDQGSFAVGGTVITAPGSFNSRKPLDPAGQTYHGDHA